MVQDEALLLGPAWSGEKPIASWDRVPLELLVPPDCPCCSEVFVASDPAARTGDPALPEPSRAVRQVLVAVEQMAAVDPVGVPGPQALVDARVLFQAAQLLRVHNLRRVGDAQTRQLHALTSARSTAAWLRAVAPDRPAGDLALARKLRQLPVLAGRIASGQLSLVAGSRVAAALWKARPELDRPDGLVDGQPAEQVLPAVVREVLGQVASCRLGMHESDPVLLALEAALEQVLVEGGSELGVLERAFVLLAEHLPLTWLGQSLGLLLDALLPNELERRAARQDGRLALQDKGSGSGWDLRAELDDETGELLHLLLTRFAQGDDLNAQDTADAAVLRTQGLDPYADPGTGDRLLGPSPVPLRRPRSRLLACTTR